MMEKLQDIPIRYLKGIGPKRAKIFNALGIYSIEDFLYYLPRRYEDRTKFTSISQLSEGQAQTIKGTVLTSAGHRSFRRRGFNIFEAVVTDQTGILTCVWFNQGYLKKYFKPGVTFILHGKVGRYAGRLQMSSPEFEAVSGDAEDSLNTGRITPVYTLPKGITQRNFRRIIRNLLDDYPQKMNDFLPYDIRSRNNFLNIAKAIINIHFPEDADMQKEAFRRLSFEEFFLFQLPLALRKLRRKEKLGIAHTVGGELAKEFIASLPFKLTAEQERVIEEIKSDMAGLSAMQRLLQGDVGSGKTVVATVAALFALDGGYQAAFMAPTEILAKQHFINIKNQISTFRLRPASIGSAFALSKRSASKGSGLMVSEAEPSNISAGGGSAYGGKIRKIKLGLLTGSIKDKERDKICRDVKEGKIDLIIGTHALLEEEVKFKNLGLAVIDEQHKFGVGQRALLPAKGANPDVLIMTATPIPRTLSITLYGDLDISVIKGLPPGRGTVKTILFPIREKSGAYAMAREQLRLGNQAYIVYPVIEESFTMDIAGARNMYEEFKEGEFKGFRIGLIHARLKQKEQDEVMCRFKNKELDVLVATTVLEVGIDISSATCMIIQNAERFGLSQLHQLRGRIGRGAGDSFCILLSGGDNVESGQRLEAMIKYSDGFRIAEQDLKIRGPGEFFGRRQHGLNELKIGDPLTQMHLLKLAREEAVKLISHDPDLSMKQNCLLKERLLRRFPEYEKLMVVG